MKFRIEQLQSVIATLPDPVFIITESGLYAAQFGGNDNRYYHDGSSLVGVRLHDVLPADKADWFMEQVAETLCQGHLCTVEYGLAGQDVEGLATEGGPNGTLWFEGRIQPLPFEVDGERAVVWVARNITRRHQLEHELRNKSELDELTGCYNRRRLLEEIDRRLREYRCCGQVSSLIMIDIDHFKTINDRFGHIVGDQVLCRLVDACRQQLREVDIFSRFGGEEFVVLVPGTTPLEACEIAERLRRTVGEVKHSFPYDDLDITISAGVSGFLDSDPDIQAALSRVDDALYQAKRSGRNCTIRH